MYQVLIVFHVVVALAIIGLVLLQQGRGADAGAGFGGGGGASNTVFGARGTASFLSRTTAIMAALFFTTSILLAYLGARQDNKQPDILDVPAAEQSNSDVPQLGNQPASAPVKSDLPEQPAAPAKPDGKN